MKKTILTILLLAVAFSARAQRLSYEEVLDNAYQFANQLKAGRDVVLKQVEIGRASCRERV